MSHPTDPAHPDSLGDKISALELMHVLVQVMREEIGLHDDFARLHAQAVCDGLRRKLGTERVYIPAPDNAQRDRAIKAEFNGCNLAEVMAKYNVSRTTVYRALAKQ